MIKILPCTCGTKSEFQDKTYGTNRRVYNQCGKESTKYRCTVCGKEIKLNS